MSKLYYYEGYPNHYDKISVKEKIDDDQYDMAITYIAQKNKIREGLAPSKAYLTRLLAAHDILSKSYYEKLKSLKTLD